MSNDKNAEANKIEKKTRGKVEKTVMIEIVDENGVAMDLKPEQVKVLGIFTKVTEEVFNTALAHPKHIRIKF